MKRLKRATIKEELVSLTGDFRTAIVLNQMIYWSERVRDFDQFIQEEIDHSQSEEDQEKEIELLNGWIYKKADELVKETMVSVDRRTMANYLNTLVDNDWIEARDNPKHNWDRTKQYRVNLKKIQHDLHKLGYSLEGYKIDLSILKFPFEWKKMHTRKLENVQAIPEITTEITNKVPYVEIVTYLNDKTSKNYKSSTQKTKDLIKARWNEGHTSEDFKKVIDNKTKDWLNDPKMDKFLRPTTLFSPKFEGYLNEDKFDDSREAFDKLLEGLDEDGEETDRNPTTRD